MKKLPREIWIMILKIKTRAAIKSRLEKMLVFPKFILKYCSKNWYEITITYSYQCGERLSRFISERRIRYNEDKPK